jgi:hypothetical protein
LRDTDFRKNNSYKYKCSPSQGQAKSILDFGLWIADLKGKGLKAWRMGHSVWHIKDPESSIKRPDT